MYKALSIFEFQELFRTEDACFHHLHTLHRPDGFRCPKYGHTKAYFMKIREIFQCAYCRNQTSLTANTIFHKIRTPLKKWFRAVYLFGSDKRGCSKVWRIWTELPSVTTSSITKVTRYHTVSVSKNPCKTRKIVLELYKIT